MGASSMLSMEVAAAWGWGATSEEEAAPTIVNNNTIESIIHSQKRFVLYNSRRLSGECLPICMDTTRPPTLQATHRSSHHHVTDDGIPHKESNECTHKESNECTNECTNKTRRSGILLSCTRRQEWV